MGVINQVTVITVNGTQMSGGNIELTIPGGTADPETGEITFPPSGGGGTSQLRETKTLNAGDIANKYFLVTTDITSDATTVLKVKTLADQYYGDDFVVDGVNKKKIKWSGLGLDGLIEAGDQVEILYS